MPFEITHIILILSSSNRHRVYNSLVNTEELIQAADRCVLCALCSAHCPTYQLHREEGESPRGRVMMSAALLRGDLEASDALIAHLNHCLLCRACEKACPSEVPYGAIIDHARVQLPAPTGKTKWLLQLSRHPRLIEALARTGKWWQRLRLPLPSTTDAALSLLPNNVDALQEHYPAIEAPIGRVGLFLGCITRPFDQQTHQSAITLLTRLGYEVIIPKQQQCCGALAQHNSAPEQAAQHTFANQQAFDQQSLDAILFSSTGCGVQLTETANDSTLPYREVCGFILQSPTLNQLSFHPLNRKVALHHPCTLRNVLQNPSTVEQLLQVIPELSWQELGPNPNCCGAAGTHQISEPETAAALRQPKLDALQQQQADLLLTTNYGCALHFAEGVQQQHRSIEVLHPVTLLARQLSPH